MSRQAVLKNTKMLLIQCKIAVEKTQKLRHFNFCFHQALFGVKLIVASHQSEAGAWWSKKRKNYASDSQNVSLTLIWKKEKAERIQSCRNTLVKLTYESIGMFNIQTMILSPFLSCWSVLVFWAFLGTVYTMEFKANDLQNGYGVEGRNKKKVKEYWLISHYEEIWAFYQRSTSIFFFESYEQVLSHRYILTIKITYINKSAKSSYSSCSQILVWYSYVSDVLNF